MHLHQIHYQSHDEGENDGENGEQRVQHPFLVEVHGNLAREGLHLPNASDQELARLHEREHDVAHADVEVGDHCRHLDIRAERLDPLEYHAALRYGAVLLVHDVSLHVELPHKDEQQNEEHAEEKVNDGLFTRRLVRGGALAAEACTHAVPYHFCNVARHVSQIPALAGLLVQHLLVPHAFLARGASVTLPAHLVWMCVTRTLIADRFTEDFVARYHHGTCASWLPPIILLDDHVHHTCAIGASCTFGALLAERITLFRAVHK
mmetsp:Transcript_1555/g.5322  ORF Transcript_1555/g.5322 Transcript_1555/m.5322 type:complete len:263 (+) Transcript_1555:1276-2064(+)